MRGPTTRLLSEFRLSDDSGMDQSDGRGVKKGGQIQETFMKIEWLGPAD